MPRSFHAAHPASMAVAGTSPCIGICSIHPGCGLCRGCARTLREIASWPTLSLAARSALHAALPARHSALASLGEPGVS